MTHKEVREHLSLKLKGDNGSFALTPLLLKEAIFDVLRNTRPLEYVVDSSEPLTSFRKLSKYQHLRLPVIDETLADNTSIDMEEELCMAVVFFLCSYGSFKKKDAFELKAINVISIYDVNITDGSDCYECGCDDEEENTEDSLSLSSTSGSVYVGSTISVSFSNEQGSVTAVSSNSAVATATVGTSSIAINAFTVGNATITISDGETTLTYTIAVLAQQSGSTITADKTFLSIDVGFTGTVTISGASGALSATSSNASLVGVSISGSVVTISAIGATDPNYVTVVITDGAGSVSVRVYSAISGGGIL